MYTCSVLDAFSYIPIMFMLDNYSIQKILSTLVIASLKSITIYSYADTDAFALAHVCIVYIAIYPHLYDRLKTSINIAIEYETKTHNHGHYMIYKETVHVCLTVVFI